MINRGFQPRFSGSVMEGAKRRVHDAWQRSRDRFRTSYLSDSPNASGARYFQPLESEHLRGWESTLSELGENYLCHNFEILGSGWTNLSYGASCGGLEGHRYDSGSDSTSDPSALDLAGRLNASNRPPARRIRALMDEDFAPIDWHRDIKSGYRWRENIWHRDIRYRNLPGVDAKVPWELARMHHLPQLALAYGLAGPKRPAFRDEGEYAREFRNQVLDFIAANPPRHGINWSCTMDIAIRAANLLVAHDLFRAYGYSFKPAFEKIFWRSMREHGRHIASNFERHGSRRNNHYLANIVGLLFVAAYLPAGRETDSWLEFAAREFLAEAKYQFFEEGGNFEASTSYHRLSAEMLLYGAALLLAIAEERLANLAWPDDMPDGHRLPAWFRARLARMAEFSIAITTPSRNVVQIGDTDSGRFLKLFPLYEKMTFSDARNRFLNLSSHTPPSDQSGHLQENHLDHSHLVAGVSALYDDRDLTNFAGADHPERQIVASLARGKKLFRGGGAKDGKAQTIGSDNELAEFLKAWEKTPAENRQSMRFQLPKTLTRDQIKTVSYPDFGLYIMRSPELYLTIRCGGEYSQQPRGHAHNDQLAIELWIEGKCVIADPGSYVYTPLPERRNSYRSVKAHFTPQIETPEPSSLEQGLFALGPPTGAECRYFASSGFVGRHKGYGASVWRAVRIAESALEILDLAEAPGHALVACEKILSGRPAFSPGYGIRCATKLGH